MRTILVKRTGVIAMLLAALGCLVVGSASASTTSTSVMVLLPSTVAVAPDNTTDTVILSTPLTLAAGASRRVSDRLGATLSSSEGAEVDNRIICLDPSGTVDLSVSLGQVSVPNVIGDNTASATHAIKAAGLTVGQISSVNNCVDPGSVLQQNPRGGTPVIPGTPVNITTATCSSGGGTPGGGNGPPIQPK